MACVSKAGVFILWALKQAGKRYQMGAEAKLTPEAFGNLSAFAEVSAWDCSELVQAGLWAVGVRAVTDSRGAETPVADFDPAWRQWERSRSIYLTDGITTPGALLFVAAPQIYAAKPHHIGHVAISLGNGYLVEARGARYGVTIGPVRPAFNRATKVDELYTPALLAKTTPT